eukprot:10404304-Alexandrium_andersonii.AAC.1
MLIRDSGHCGPQLVGLCCRLKVVRGAMCVAIISVQALRSSLRLSGALQSSRELSEALRSSPKLP